MVKHTVHGGGMATIFDRIKKFSTEKVAVGVPTDKNSRNDSRKNVQVGNADLVYIHTHGVRPRAMRKEMQPEIDKGTQYSIVLQMYLQAHGSVVYRVPVRPIIEPAIEHYSKGIAELMKSAMTAAAEGQNWESKLQDVGLYASSKVKDWFTNPENGWAPNAKSTIEGWTAPWTDKKTDKHPFFPGKGSDRPLINTGALRDAITYIVDKGGDGND